MTLTWVLQTQESSMSSKVFSVPRVSPRLSRATFLHCRLHSAARFVSPFFLCLTEGPGDQLEVWPLDRPCRQRWCSRLCCLCGQPSFHPAVAFSLWMGKTLPVWGAHLCQKDFSQWTRQFYEERGSVYKGTKSHFFTSNTGCGATL